MARYDDIHPDHIDPETNRPYDNYSSPSLDEGFDYDREEEEEEEEEEETALGSVGGYPVIAARILRDGRAVLCRRRLVQPFVVWNVDKTGCATSGVYYQTAEEAHADLARRR